MTDLGLSILASKCSIFRNLSFVVPHIWVRGRLKFFGSAALSPRVESSTEKFVPLGDLPRGLKAPNLVISK